MNYNHYLRHTSLYLIKQTTGVMLFVRHHEPAMQQDGSIRARRFVDFLYEGHKTSGRHGNITSGIPIRKHEMLHCSRLFTRLSVHNQP